jgi:hypothetical protein
VERAPKLEAFVTGFARGELEIRHLAQGHF